MKEKPPSVGSFRQISLFGMMDLQKNAAGDLAYTRRGTDAVVIHNGDDYAVWSTAQVFDDHIVRAPTWYYQPGQEAALHWVVSSY